MEIRKSISALALLTLAASAVQASEPQRFQSSNEIVFNTGSNAGKPAKLNIVASEKETTLSVPGGMPVCYPATCSVELTTADGKTQLDGVPTSTGNAQGITLKDPKAFSGTVSSGKPFSVSMQFVTYGNYTFTFDGT